MKSILKWVPAAAACALLAACATGPATKGAAQPKSTTAEAAVTQRAEARWNDLIAHDGAKAWEFLTPGYRKTVTREDYAKEMNNRPLQWQSVKVKDVTCAAADRCLAHVLVTYKIDMPRVGGGTTFAPLAEDWLRLGGQWYYLPRETGGNTLKSAH